MQTEWGETTLTRLRAGRWTLLPGTCIEVCAVDADGSVEQRWDGVWDLSKSQVLLLIRKVDAQGRPLTWPWPIAPMPKRT